MSRHRVSRMGIALVECGQRGCERVVLGVTGTSVTIEARHDGETHRVVIPLEELERIAQERRRAGAIDSLAPDRVTSISA